MKTYMRVNAKIMLISCIFILIISACSKEFEQPEVIQESGTISAPQNPAELEENQVTEEEEITSETEEETTTTPTEPKSPPIIEVPKLSLSIYGVDPELTELVAKKTEIDYVDDITVLHAMLNQLKENETEEWIPLWKKIEFTSVNLVEGNVMIDVSFDDSARSGASVELYMIDSLLATVFQLPAIQTVTILVDGEKSDSLMGHVSIDEPFSRQ